MLRTYLRFLVKVCVCLCEVATNEEKITQFSFTKFQRDYAPTHGDSNMSSYVEHRICLKNFNLYA